MEITVSAQIFEINHRLADVWIASDSQIDVNYSYGGTRMVHPHVDNTEVNSTLTRLMLYESTLKNRLINYTIRQGMLEAYRDRAPKGFLESAVSGARCLIRPRTAEVAAVLDDPDHREFHAVLEPIFESIGEFLNRMEGRIKLTPDFGRFAGLSDILVRYTPHVLGIRCEDGGCGGKSSYSSTGIVAALEAMDVPRYKDGPLTLIGSAGALGSDVLAYFLQDGYRDLAVCDLVYDDPRSGARPPVDLPRLPSRWKMFTPPCLERGGVIVATTVGGELENSRWQAMPSGALLFLAHNLAVPHGDEGIALMSHIADHGVFAVPGQVLTLGGALTSRLEWFWRQSKPDVPFDKPLAHAVVRDAVRYLVTDIQARAAAAGVTLYEAMLDLTGLRS